MPRVSDVKNFGFCEKRNNEDDDDFEKSVWFGALALED